MYRVSQEPERGGQAISRQRLGQEAEETCLCWVMRGISTSWLGEAISCRRCGVDAEAFCLFRHTQTRKKRHAMTKGMAMLGTRMYRIPILLPSWGPADSRGHGFLETIPHPAPSSRQPTPAPRCKTQAQGDGAMSCTEGKGRAEP